MNGQKNQNNNNITLLSPCHVEIVTAQKKICRRQWCHKFVFSRLDGVAMRYPRQFMMAIQYHDGSWTRILVPFSIKTL